MDGNACQKIRIKPTKENNLGVTQALSLQSSITALGLV